MIAAPPTPITRRDMRRNIGARLKAAGFDDGDICARLIIMAVTAISREALVLESDVTIDPDVRDKIERAVHRRLAGEPLDSILGYSEFYGYRFYISKHVLSPRPETELLVSKTLNVMRSSQNLKILDLGTGSGAILQTLLCERPDATGVGVDCSPDALNVARKNAQFHHLSDRLRLIESDWFSDVQGQFDVVVSNPPYIDAAHMDALPKEVRDFDPVTALAGGDDGLAAYRKIIPATREYLRLGGYIVLEIGYDQGQSVKDMVKAAGFEGVKVDQDLAGHDRIVSACFGGKHSST